MELKIDFPKYIKNDHSGLSFLNETLFEVQNDYYTGLVLDFSKTRWFEANLVAVLGLCIKESQKRGNSVTISNLSNSIKKVFKKNGFYSYYNLGGQEDTFDSTIQFKVFDVKSTEEFAEYVSSEVIPKIRMEISESVRKSLTASLNELFVNVSFHAKSDEVITCGQYYHTHKKVAFTIVDKGLTIPENYRNKYNKDITDQESIKWATAYGNTTRDGENFGGLGLHIIDSFLQSNNGIFQIMSGYGYWEREGKHVNTINFPKQFPGAVVNIITKLENTGFKFDDEDIFF